jgi:hypothetical protein
VVVIRLAGEKHPEIADDEAEAGQRVDKRQVDMLETEHRPPRIMRRETHQAVGLEVFIQPGDVGVGVMPHIVLLAPDEAAAAQQLEGEAHDLVHPGLVRIAAMDGIVHDVESGAGHGKAKEHAQKQIDQGRKPAQQNQEIGSEPPGRNDGGLEIHLRHIPRGQIVGLEIRIDPLIEDFAEAELLGKRQGLDGVIFDDRH